MSNVTKFPIKESKDETLDDLLFECPDCPEHTLCYLGVKGDTLEFGAICLDCHGFWSIEHLRETLDDV